VATNMRIKMGYGDCADDNMRIIAWCLASAPMIYMRIDTQTWVVICVLHEAIG
jgi:hypothetical protein